MSQWRNYVKIRRFSVKYSGSFIPRITLAYPRVFWGDVSPQKHESRLHLLSSLKKQVYILYIKYVNSYTPVNKVFTYISESIVYNLIIIS